MQIDPLMRGLAWPNSLRGAFLLVSSAFNQSPFFSSFYKGSPFGWTSLRFRRGLSSWPKGCLLSLAKRFSAYT